ncbi:MAG: hypothetical protein V3V30_06245 [Parvularculaceae bacterium]
MSAFATLLTTAIAAIGAVKFARYAQKRAARTEAHLRNASDKDQVTLDAKRNAETGVFEAK